MVVSSLIAVILGDEMSGYVGNRGMKTFILSFFHKANTLGCFFLTLHKNYLVAQFVCFLSGKGANIDGTHYCHMHSI